MAGRIQSVAIIGGGPSGALLAHYLGRAGLTVALFDRAQRPPLVVGESLVPATVGFLRELGIEGDVRSYSTFKPGATFVFGPEDVFNLRFDEVRAAKFKYTNYQLVSRRGYGDGWIPIGGRDEILPKLDAFADAKASVG